MPSITVCGVDGRTLSVGFYPSRFGWMNLDVERKAPKWGASSLVWHSCQVKSYELVCLERAYVRCRLHDFAINIKLFSPYLHSWILPWWILPHFWCFLLHSWHVTRKGGREDKEWRSCEVPEQEHCGFAKQHEECLLVNVTSRWIVVIRCWILHRILCQLSACKLEFTALKNYSCLYSKAIHSFNNKTSKKKKVKKPRVGSESQSSWPAPGHLCPASGGSLSG